MTAVTVDASSPAVVGTSALTATTASFTPPAGRLIVALCGIGNSTATGTVTGTVTDSLGSTWTMLRRLTNSTHGTVEMWAMDAGGSPAARTVTLTGSGANGMGTAIAVQVLNNARSLAHLQALGDYSSAASGTGTNLNVTAGATGSIAFHVLALSGSTTLTGPQAAATSIGQFNDATNAYTFGFTKNTAAMVAQASKTLGWTNTITSTLGTHIMLEFPPADSPLQWRIIYLSNDTATGVTAGSGTKKLAYLFPQKNASLTVTTANKTTVNGPTAPLQYTDSTVSLVDGTALSWYTVPLAAGSLGAISIQAQFYGSETNLLANAAPVFRLERCSNDGTVLSTIVDHTVNQNGTEYSTGIASRLPATTATATSWVDGDRLRITAYIDDAADQGGTGSMAATYGSTIQYNAIIGNTGAMSISAGTSYITEALPVAVSGAESGATTIPTATLSFPVAAAATGQAAALAITATSGTVSASGTGAAPGNTSALVITTSTGTAAGTGTAVIQGSASALTLSPASGSVSVGPSAITGNASALAITAGSGSATASGTVGILGNAAALAITKNPGSLQTGTSQIPGNSTALAITSSPGAAAGTGAVALAGNARALTLTAASGDATAGAVLPGSAAALSLSAASGAAVGTGAAQAPGAPASATLSAQSGSVQATGAAVIQGSASNLVLAPAAGSAVGVGSGAADGSAGTIALAPGTGSVAPTTPAVILGASADLVLAPSPGAPAANGVALIPGSAASVALTGAPGAVEASGAATAEGNSRALFVLAHAGGLHAVTAPIEGSTTDLVITAGTGLLRIVRANVTVLAEVIRMSFVAQDAAPEGSAVSVRVGPVALAIRVPAVTAAPGGLDLSLDGAEIDIDVRPVAAASGPYVISYPVFVLLRAQAVGGDAWLWPVEIDIDVRWVEQHSGAVVAVAPATFGIVVPKVRLKGGTTAPFMRPVRVMVSSEQADAGNLELAWPR